MKNFLKTLVASLVVIACGWLDTAQAITPESGLWANPAASGTGYNIEVQDNLLAVTIYSTDANGAPIYFLAAGPMTGDNQFYGTMQKFSGGQCFGCPYKAPVVTPSGPVSLVFTNAQTANVSVNGGAPIPISRVAFGVNPNDVSVLLGGWGFVTPASATATYYSAWNFQLKTSDVTNGVTYVRGSNVGRPDRVAVGQLRADGFFQVLLDYPFDPDNYLLFQFKLTTFNMVEGVFWKYAKGTVPTGVGLPFFGIRSQSAALAATGVGPGIPN
jgi:hypothetical protein